MEETTEEMTVIGRRVRFAGPAALIAVAAVLSLILPGPAPGQTPAGIVRDTTGLRREFADLARLDSTIHLDIRYATAHNFIGKPVYARARAFLRLPAAEALLRAHRALRTKGYGIIIFDGYRPWSVTKLFWDSTPPGQRAFVADPAQGSRHNRGCAVDLSMYDLRTGTEVEMPSGYDDFTERAAVSYAGGTAAERSRRDLLRHAMEAEGFVVEPLEWWHFDYKGWRSCPLYDIPFEDFP
jgi:D-alanyl-D-alanine dipeptidase